MFESLFNYDNPFWRFMGKVGDLLILNFLFLICSLPLVTFGASLSALYYSVFRLYEGKGGGTVAGFFHAFKQNLLQGSLLGIIAAIFGLALAADFRILHFYTSAGTLSGSISFVLGAVMSFAALLYFFVFLYVFPLQARFYNPVRKTLWNALLLSLRCLPRTLLILLMDAALCLLSAAGFVYLPQVCVLLFLLLVPFICLCNAVLMKNLLQLVKADDSPAPEYSEEGSGDKP